jgi:hypothetical protein
LSRPLLRRDLFDARFQLINQEQQGDYVDANTDLIPGIYEGGLKTWEGGVDLVEVLAEGGFDGKSVLEVCSTRERADKRSDVERRYHVATSSNTSYRLDLEKYIYKTIISSFFSLSLCQIFY